jgi:hypothetical protein
MIYTRCRIGKSLLRRKICVPIEESADRHALTTRCHYALLPIRSTSQLRVAQGSSFVYSQDHEWYARVIHLMDGNVRLLALVEPRKNMQRSRTIQWAKVSRD